MDLNKVMLIGNLTRDPEVRTTPQGVPVASFGLATNLIWKDQSGNRQQKAEFHNIVAWRKLGETCGQYLKRGSKVYVEGRLQTRSWDDQSGNKKYRTEIILDSMIMLDRKESGGSYQPSTPTQTEPESVQVVPPASEEVNIEEIPF
ncbi:single-stranded DNA-binding protein [Patescibacteria group bacterium]|nr:MAG: single-stranded DNA-binding protein [Patescibacteria group bacterium]